MSSIVSRVCAIAGVCRIGQKKLNPPRLDSGIEAWARTERYQFFQQAMAQEELAYIALAHNADDQAETVLFRLLRGSGRRGLAGMAAKRNLGGPRHGQLIRPLLACSRQEILAYVTDRQLPYAIDPSNSDVHFARNRIRHRLLPFLEEEFSPQIRRHLPQLAEMLGAEEDWLEHSAAGVFLELQSQQTEQDTGQERAGTHKRLSVQGVMHAPAALRPRILRQWIQQAGFEHDRYELGFAHLDQLRALCEGEIHGIVELPGEYCIRIVSGQLVLESKDAASSPKPYVYTLARGQTLALPYLGWRFALSLPQRWTGQLSQARLTTPWRAIFDAQAIPETLTIRSFRPGDRIFPLGMGGKKKTHDVFIDAKIPQWQRRLFPLIALNPSDAEIVWIPGHVRGRAALVTETTREVCQFDVSPLPQKP